MTGGEGVTEWSSRNTDGGTDRAERTEGREGDRTGGNGPRKRERGGGWRDGRRWRDGCSESAGDRQMKERA